MSAWFKPACGHAPATLSTLTASAGRVFAAGSVGGSPVSGSTFVVDGAGLAELGDVDETGAAAGELGIAEDAGGAEVFAELEFALVHAAGASSVAAATRKPIMRRPLPDRLRPAGLGPVIGRVACGTENSCFLRRGSRFGGTSRPDPTGHVVEFGA
jgi:hypothetical protein